MKKSLFVSATVVLLAVSSMIDGRRPGCLQRHLKIVGIVIGYNQLAPLVNITDAPQQQILLVRVDKAVAGGRYLKIIYKYGVNEPSLPDELFDGKSKWRFNLKRDCGCDGPLNRNQSKSENGIAIATWKGTVESDGPPENAELPCYVLRQKGFKPAPEKSRKS